MAKKKKVKDRKCKTQISEASLREIEDRLMNMVLGGSLALQIIRNSKKPTCELVEELLSLEAQVGEFVGMALKSSIGSSKGSLVNALSFVPVGQNRADSKIMRRPDAPNKNKPS